MSKGLTWGIVIVVVLAIVLFFVFNKPESGDVMGTDTTSIDTSSEDTINESETTTSETQDLGINLDESRTTINIDGSNFKFVPNKIEVKKGNTVEIVFKNSQGYHDFVIDEFSVRTTQMQAGNTETITFVADKVGSFEYYCSVGTHRQMGMVGTLIVTE